MNFLARVRLYILSRAWSICSLTACREPLAGLNDTLLQKVQPPVPLVEPAGECRVVFIGVHCVRLQSYKYRVGTRYFNEPGITVQSKN